LAAYSAQIYRLIDSVFSGSQVPLPEDDRKSQRNKLNANFHKKEFQSLWHRIHTKAVYAVQFNSAELIEKCIAALDAELRVAPLQYVVQRGEQLTDASYETVHSGEAFRLTETQTASLKSSVHSAVKYDLIGKLAEQTQLTRATVGRILGSIKPSVYAYYQVNPEDFLRNAGRLINEQKATVVVDHLTYSAVDEAYGVDIFTEEKLPTDSGRAVRTNRHIFDYVFTDSKNERDFVALLDSGTEIEVYAKLPKAFSIPTPVGGYTPDWAIPFRQGTVRHVYFVAETKGSMSSMEFRKIEETKIECARKFFSRIISEQVKYGVVSSYAKLMELVQ
jgi:type III restriction enzyme